MAKRFFSNISVQAESEASKKIYSLRELGLNNVYEIEIHILETIINYFPGKINVSVR